MHKILFLLLLLADLIVSFKGTKTTFSRRKNLDTYSEKHTKHFGIMKAWLLYVYVTYVTRTLLFHQ